MKLWWRAGGLCLATVTSHAPSLEAQLQDIRGYILNVGVPTLSGPLNSEAFSNVSRFRLMTRATAGPASFEIAYEHLTTYSSRSRSVVPSALTGGASSTDWLPIQGNLHEGSHLSWRHKLDRLALSISDAAGIDFTFGRQTLSWATTLILTPADPFVPFDPSDPFREYRAGVDAVRVHYFPGPLSELEFALRPAQTPFGNTLTALGRGHAVVESWELAAWLGVVHDEAAASFGFTKTLLGAALRGESTVRRSEDRTVLRFVIGIDGGISIGSKNLYTVIEYRRDGFGFSSVDGLLQTAMSKPARRGELQALGRDVVALQTQYPLHPLISVQQLSLINLNDGSVLFTPSLAYSARDNLSVNVGAFLGVGPNLTPEGIPASEFGPLPTTGFASLSTYF